jgi:hypothetical protein
LDHERVSWACGGLCGRKKECLRHAGIQMVSHSPAPSIISRIEVDLIMSNSATCSSTPRMDTSFPTQYPKLDLKSRKMRLLALSDSTVVVLKTLEVIGARKCSILPPLSLYEGALYSPRSLHWMKKHMVHSQIHRSSISGGFLDPRAAVTLPTGNIISPVGFPR